MLTTGTMATERARPSSWDLTWMCFRKRSQPGQTTPPLSKPASELLPRIWSNHRDDPHLCWIDEHHLLVHARELIELRYRIIGDDFVR